MATRKNSKQTTNEGRLPDRELLASLLEDSASRHHHLCPRQVLAVRMALSGLFALGLIGENGLPRYQNQDKRLLALVETDGCAADGISVATDCSVGRRTLRVLDYGKVAATFVDTIGGAAFRASPSPRARARALQYAKGASSPWHAYLEGYQLVPNNELVVIRPVRLTRPISEILSKPGNRVKCSACEEEIMNERETLVDGIIFCRSCAGESYYSAVNST